MVIDVTDDSFETEVLARSETVPVIVDLWAPWCGPCRTLGPIIEKVVDDTNGKAVLAKINIDENPQASAAFRVQSIPAVYAVSDRQVVNGFVGAQGEDAVRQFVSAVLPSATDEKIAALVATADEASLRAALELDPGHEVAIVALAELLARDGKGDEALALLERIPETTETRRVAALARVGDEFASDGAAAAGEITPKLDALLDRVKHDDQARQEFVDLLELLGPADPLTAQYRKALTSRLF
ncbi:MAG TPA: tetratricopeptide repeat protein [Acidimicrobiales bacterium]|jgi:putative thioredoxin|nr:tetratricopeptide repeat protein [Acidimicrobiales bacterium]